MATVTAPALSEPPIRGEAERCLRILYFHQHFSTRGGAAGTRSYEMARHLVAVGHQVTMVCGSAARSHTGIETEFVGRRREGFVDGIRVIEIEAPYSNYQGLLKRTGTFLRYAARATGIALQEEYDVVFATSTPLTAAIPGIAARWLRRKKFVFEVRDLWPELPRAMGVIRNPLVLQAMAALELAAYRSAHRCIGLAPGIVEGIRRTGVPAERTAMIPNGCDLDLFAPVDATPEPEPIGGEARGLRDSDGGELSATSRTPIVTERPVERPFQDIPGIEAGDFVAIFTGAHGIANGLDAVLDAAVVLRDRGTRGIRLLMVGDGGQKPRLVRRAREERLDACVFLEPVPKHELAQLVRSADVGLMILANVPAFHYGTSPNKFFDYLASGTPVLNNYPGWLAEMIEEHRCGVVVPPDDAEAFADALERLRSDPAFVHAAGKRARRLAESRFARTQLARQFAAVIEAVTTPVGAER